MDKLVILEFFFKFPVFGCQVKVFFMHTNTRTHISCLLVGAIQSLATPKAPSSDPSLSPCRLLFIYRP